MKIGLAVCKIENNKTKKNKSKILKTIKKAHRQQIDILLFSEAALQGFDSLSWNYAEDRKIAIPMCSSIIEEIAHSCRKYAVAVGFGYIEREDRSIYSSYTVIGKDGAVITNYRRMSPGWRIQETDHHYMEGNTAGFFSYMDRQFCIGLCGDFWTDSVLQQYHGHTAPVCWPVFTNYTRKEWARTAQDDYEEQTKKIGSCVFQINHISKNKSKAAGGAYYYRHGKRIKKLNMGKEGILRITLPAT